MRVTENAAYLKGYAEGLGIDEATKEGKVLVKLLDLVSEMAERISALEDENDELYAYIEEMGEDIIAIEDDIYGEDEAEYDDLDDLLAEDDEYGCEEIEYYEVECPSCGEKICFTEDVELDELRCPACGELVGEIELCDGDCDSCADSDACEDK